MNGTACDDFSNSEANKGDADDDGDGGDHIVTIMVINQGRGGVGL